MGYWRIIPARAGFTVRMTVACPWWADHPRSRGVYDVETRVMGAVSGSSPLARGLQVRDDEEPWWDRIIPARAGFTTHAVVRASVTEDHPRSRGVYGTTRRPIGGQSGSSPLARGLLGWGASLPSRCRIIPARAGFTKPARGPRPHPRDHPRSRGVYAFLEIPGKGHFGSSPLARGLPPAGSA